MRFVFALTPALLMAAPAALAGEQYVDPTGYAVSGYDVVAYHALDQAPVGEAQPDAVLGRGDITHEWNGATWAFATEANRDAFAADPAAFAPAFDGHCAYGISKGGKVPANPHLWRIVDGTLYLNITPTVVGFFEEDIAGNVTLANDNWTDLEATPASAKPIPDFSGTGPAS